MPYKYVLNSSGWDHREVDAAVKVLNSGHTSMGAEVSLFEKNFSEYHDSNYSVMVNSGSSANLLIFAAIRYSNVAKSTPGTPNVIVPAVSWATTYTPAFQLGFHQKVVDVYPDTWNINLESVRNVIDENTVAIVAVNLLGQASNLPELRKICDDFDLLLIEDNCESFGAEIDGLLTGTYGDFASFSFFYSHHLNTMEGGMVMSKTEANYQHLLALRAHGWLRNLPEKNSVKNRDINDYYDTFTFVLPGFNLRPTEIQGAIGNVQLEKANRMLETRRENAEYFKENMNKYPQISIQKGSGRSSWFGFGMLLPPGKRNELVKLLDEREIQSRPIVAGNIVKHPVSNYMQMETSRSLLVADNIHANGLFIGNHPSLIEKELNLFFGCLKEMNWE